MRPARSVICLLAVSVAVAACGDPSGPDRDRGPRLRFVSGADLTDTITARPAAALVVEVHDSSGALAPQGTVVRFTGVPTAAQGPEMFVQGLTATTFTNFAAGETDAAGRVGVLVMFGMVAGPRASRYRCRPSASRTLHEAGKRSQSILMTDDQ